MPHVLTVNLGPLASNADPRRLPTGIDKRPYDGLAEIRAPGGKLAGLGSGLVGDAIGDHRHHGGDDQAVYAYAREELDDWARRLGRSLRSGMFGENLTTSGLDVSDALLGERWQVGDTVVLQVTGPRVPCGTFRAHMAEKGWLKTFTQVAGSGAYLSVVTPGTIRAGDEITVVHRPDHEVTSRLAFRALTLERRLLPELLAAGDDLPEELREMARDFDDHIDQMGCDPTDRHVLAAAVRGGADTVVTFNLKDFPDEAGAPHGIGTCHPDGFLVQLLGEHTATVLATLERETSAFQNPPETVAQFLATLTATAPMFASLAADAFSGPTGPASTVPALVGVDEQQAIAALGEPGDPTNPAQVAFAWWAGLSTTSTWPGISPTIPQRGMTTGGRSTTSPTGPWPRRSFTRSTRLTRSPSCDSFPRWRLRPRCSRRTCLTLVRVENGTWRVWGLGPAIRSARDIIGS